MEGGFDVLRSFSCLSLTLMPFTTVTFSFSSDSKDTRRVLLLAPISVRKTTTQAFSTDASLHLAP